MSELKLIQIFLTPKTAATPSYAEVSMDDKKKLVCNCPGYRGKHRCKHVSLVQERLDDHNGDYPLEVTGKPTEDDMLEANKSIEAMNAFIRRYGRIEVY